MQFWAGDRRTAARLAHKTWLGLVSLRLRSRQGHDMEPKLLDRPNGREILVDIKRLDDVATHLFVVCAVYVGTAIAGADHDDRDTLEPLVVFHCLQNIMPVDLREVE